MKTVSLKRLLILTTVWFFGSGVCVYAAESGYQGLLVEPAKILKAQMMIDHKGQSISFPQKNGNMKFVFFGYTSCPDVCPMTLSKIKLLIKELGPEAKDVEYYFVSIDPQRDNTSQLKHFVSYYDKNITGITGNPRAIKALENEFGILTRKFQGKSAFAYTLEHSVFIYLLDRQGRLRVMYPASASTKSIIKDIELLRKNNKELAQR
jgi:protein SCO1/2